MRWEAEGEPSVLTEQWIMGEALGWQAQSLWHVLNSQKGIEELLRFIERTEQFKAMLRPSLTSD